MGQTVENLQENDIQIEEVPADGGYSSGSCLKYPEEENIEAYVSPHSGYKPQREGFTYNAQEDCYICSQGKRLVFTGIKKDNTRKTTSGDYHTRVEDCRDCPLKSKCANKRGIKTITDSSDKPYYDRTYRRTSTAKGKQMKRLRSATVEPVPGTLLHFRAMKKVYTKGISLANKHVLMAAAAYNLKKLLACRQFKAMATAMQNVVSNINGINAFIFSEKSKCLTLVFPEYKRNSCFFVVINPVVVQRAQDVRVLRRTSCSKNRHHPTDKVQRTVTSSIE
jgi:hypothetical protein